MARPARTASDSQAPLSAGEARLEALLDERLSPQQRQAFARQLDAHDRARAPTELDVALLRRRMRFRGTVPERVRTLLSEWVPELMRCAEANGLSLRDPYQELWFYTQAAFESEEGPLPAGLTLPASSFRHNPVYRRYRVRVVLPARVESTDALLAVVRALLTRLYGDVLLREEVLPLPAYREDVEGASADVSVGLPEQVAVLGALTFVTPELEAALRAYARTARIDYNKKPEQARMAWFAEAARGLAAQSLSRERQAVVESTFAAYVEALRANVPGGVQAALAAVEAQNHLLRFLSPDAAAHHARLSEQQPLAFLRAVNLRLEFLLEATAGLAEDFEAMSAEGGTVPTLAAERVAGWLDELEQGGLARPYLVPGVRLSEALERKRGAFPLEVHGLMAGFPPEARNEALFNSLRKSLEGSMHQRLYNALVLMRHGMRRQDEEQGEAFAKSEVFQTLKGLVANFRFRRPLLEGLFLFVGVVLEVAEHAPGAKGDGARARFPVEAFSRAWGQFAAHALLAEFLAQRRVKGFDPAHYWAQVEGRWQTQVDAGQAGAQLTHLLRRIQVSAGGAGGLAVLAEALRQSTPTFRFTVTQALRPRPESKDAEAWRAQLDAWAQSVLEARERSLRNAIVPSDTAS